MAAALSASADGGDGGLDLVTLHLPLAGACLALGLAAAVARRRLPAGPARGAIVPVAGIVVTAGCALSTGRGTGLPLAVVAAAVLGALVARAVAGVGDRCEFVACSNWVLCATIAGFAYLSVPDTEWAVAALGLAVPLAMVEVVAPRPLGPAPLGAEVGTGVALAVGALLVGSSGSIGWIDWWAAKLAGAAVALAALVVLAVRTSGRGRRPPGRREAHRG